MAKGLRLSFTYDELIEVERALRLIMGEDSAADVNMTPEEVAAKQSAQQKLIRALRAGPSSAVGGSPPR